MKKARLLMPLLLLGLALEAPYAQAYIYGRPIQKFALPDILGLKTLAGDFHMHTIYSDGSVLPEVRVNEIYREGLSALAITDHAEFSPIIPELPKNSNRSNEVGQRRAEELGLVFATGTEITRDFNQDEFSAHFVCLFIEDVNKIEQADTIEMLREAKRQGAFVFWAHPWEAKDWGAEVEALIKEGLLDGVEILNQGHFSSEALAWAVERGLTLMGDTDSHDPIFYGRPLTLAFAKEKSAPALREAMLEGRTLVLSGSTLYGEEKYLAPLFYESVKVKNPQITVSAAAPGKLVFVNTSSINYRIIVDTEKYDFSLRKEIIIEANKETTVNLTKKASATRGKKDISLSFINANMFTKPGQSPRMELRLTVTTE